MSNDRHRLVNLRYLAHKLSKEWHSGVAHGVVAIRLISMFMGGFTILASIGCLLCLIAYLGYERSAEEIRGILRCFRIIQAVFVVNLLFDFIFNFKRTVMTTRPIKWIVDERFSQRYYRHYALARTILGLAGWIH